MKMHILRRGPHKGYLRLTIDSADRQYIRENMHDIAADSILSDLMEGANFQLLNDYDIAQLNEHGYTSILSSNTFIASEHISAMQNDMSEFGWVMDAEGNFIEDGARDLDALGIKLYHYDWTYELETEALLRAGHVDFKPLN